MGVEETGEEAIQLVQNMRHPYVNIKALGVSVCSSYDGWMCVRHVYPQKVKSVSDPLSGAP